MLVPIIRVLGCSLEGLATLSDTTVEEVGNVVGAHEERDHPVAYAVHDMFREMVVFADDWVETVKTTDPGEEAVTLLPVFTADQDDAARTYAGVSAGYWNHAVGLIAAGLERNLIGWKLRVANGTWPNR